MELNNPIKTARVVTVNGTITIDYRTHASAKLPKGRTNNRFRFSTNKEDSKAALKYVEKHKFELALAHYESLLDNLENTEEVFFKDIAYQALKEAEINRRKHDGTNDYLNILDKFVLLFFGSMLVKNIQVKDVRAWMLEMSKLKISQRRFYKYYYVLNRVMAYAAENGYIISNPMLHVKRSSPIFAKAESKDTQYFTKDEVETILNAPFEGTTDRERRRHNFIIAFLYIAFFTGGRTGEIMALRRSDIDFINKTITYRTSMRKGVLSTTKTGKSRTVPMVKRVGDVLLKWLEENVKGEYVFSVPNKGAPYRESRVIADHMYKPLLERLRIPYKILYSTRSTFASLAAERGVSMLVISKCLGHSDLATTQRFYIRIGKLDEDISRDELEKFAA